MKAGRLLPWCGAMLFGRNTVHDGSRIAIDGGHCCVNVMTEEKLIVTAARQQILSAVSATGHEAER
jgi:hypothetical protein